MKIGFIGMGNMGGALALGLIKYGKINNIRAFAPNQVKLKENADKIGFIPVSTLKKLAEDSDTIILACKPHQVDGVLDEIGNDLKGKAVISIVLGLDFEKWKSKGLNGVRFQFVMPNTPVSTGDGVLIFEEDNSLFAGERADIMRVFERVGLVTELSSGLMDIGGSVSGCGPAFVSMFIEAYADAAVKYGIPREIAYKMVSTTVMGTAKLQLYTGEHPAVIKDKVCSPGGSTIKGVAALEREGLRRACQASIDEIMR